MKPEQNFSPWSILAGALVGVVGIWFGIRSLLAFLKDMLTRLGPSSLLCAGLLGYTGVTTAYSAASSYAVVYNDSGSQKSSLWRYLDGAAVNQPFGTVANGAWATNNTTGHEGKLIQVRDGGAGPFLYPQAGATIVAGQTIIFNFAAAPATNWCGGVSVVNVGNARVSVMASNVTTGVSGEYTVVYPGYPWQVYSWGPSTTKNIVRLYQIKQNADNYFYFTLIGTTVDGDNQVCPATTTATFYTDGYIWEKHNTDDTNGPIVWDGVTDTNTVALDDTLRKGIEALYVAIKEADSINHSDNQLLLAGQTTANSTLSSISSSVSPLGGKLDTVNANLDSVETKLDTGNSLNATGNNLLANIITNTAGTSQNTRLDAIWQQASNTAFYSKDAMSSLDQIKIDAGQINSDGSTANDRLAGIKTATEGTEANTAGLRAGLEGVRTNSTGGFSGAHSNMVAEGNGLLNAIATNTLIMSTNGGNGSGITQWLAQINYSVTNRPVPSLAGMATNQAQAEALAGPNTAEFDEAVDSVPTEHPGLGSLAGVTSTLVAWGGHEMDIDPFTGSWASVWAMFYDFSRWILIACFMTKIAVDSHLLVQTLGAAQQLRLPNIDATFLGIGGNWGALLGALILPALLALFGTAIAFFSDFILGQAANLAELTGNPLAGAYPPEVGKGVTALGMAFPLNLLASLTLSYIVFRLTATKVLLFLTTAVRTLVG